MDKICDLWYDYFGTFESEEEVAMANAKAIFVDFASLQWMRRSLGIGKYDYRALHGVLSTIGNATVCFFKPFCALLPEHAYIEKTLQNSGFAMQTAEPKKDDELLIEKIRALSPDDVSEIILVSADGDYYPVLKEKCDSGIAVWVVATKNLDPVYGRKTLSSSLLDPDFNFVKLEDYRDKIMLEPWQERERKIEQRPEPMLPRRRITLTFEFPEDPALVKEIMALHAEFVVGHGGVKMTVVVE